MVIRNIYQKGEEINSVKYLAELEPKVYPSGKRQRFCLFECSCGKEFSAVLGKILSGHTKSCGCKKQIHNVGDVINGIKFLREAEKSVKPNGTAPRKGYFECPSCKKEWISVISKIAEGEVKGCGCRRGEMHGMSKTRLFRIWNGMKNRCTNPNDDRYKNYGARGISVCDKWYKSFTSFKNWAENNGYTDVLTIERNNVNGNYSPQNCSWATVAEQAHNTRRNVLNWERVAQIRNLRQTMSVRELAKQFDVSDTTIKDVVNHKKWKITA